MKRERKKKTRNVQESWFSTIAKDLSCFMSFLLILQRTILTAQRACAQAVGKHLKLACRNTIKIISSLITLPHCQVQLQRVAVLHPTVSQVDGRREDRKPMQDATNRQRCCARSRNSLPHSHKKAKSSNSWQEVNKQTLLSFHISHPKMPHLPLLRLMTKYKLLKSCNCYKFITNQPF